MNSISMFLQLLYTRLYSVRHHLCNKIVNISIWSFCNLLVFGYIMQEFGLGEDFGLFQVGGVIAAAGLFENYSNIAAIIMDFAGECSISYYLTLPTTPGVILLSLGCMYALVGLLLSFAMLLLGKILFFNSLHIAAICWPKLLAILVVSNLFYGFLAIAIAGHINKVAKIGNVWSRFIFPLWFLGGYQFSWMAMYKALPLLSYVLLLNPVTYIMDGTRAALLGQAGYISWEICFVILCVCTFGTWCAAYNRMQKVLDFV